MSARAVTVWFIDTDDPIGFLRSDLTTDVTTAQQMANTIYGDRTLVPIRDTDLATAAAAQDPHVYVGAYGAMAVVSCSLFATTTPSTLTRTIRSLRETAAATLLFTDPDDSVGAFARWENGVLKRSFAADPVHIVEDEGLPYPFERPFWAGEHPLRYAPGVPPDPMALPFHPQHIAEQANREWLGFRFTHPLADTDRDPAQLPVTAFAIRPADYVAGDEDWARYQEGTSETDAPTPDVAPSKRRNPVARYFGF
ncbi:hypothetical protein AAFP30_18515 [Gordonia sp. CPCC 205515]|uniref:DUF6928 family protein n=1 Tax=Gordonia sp. CPCC 205515 TaxID=3140791 RepID=UPI003AF3B20C